MTTRTSDEADEGDEAIEVAADEDDDDDEVPDDAPIGPGRAARPADARPWRSASPSGRGGSWVAGGRPARSAASR